MNPTWNITPIDGRYQNKTAELADYFSEGALISYRVKVEAAWLLFLSNNASIQKDIQLSDAAKARLQDFWKNGISKEQASAVKDIEATTNHDVKAVEYFLRDELTLLDCNESELAFIHFACTSEDINNLSYALMLKDARNKIIVPSLNTIQQEFATLAKAYASIPMLSRTHGQTASPTTVGKEFAVFAYRLNRKIKNLSNTEILGKINGAVGNFNAHRVAYPNLDWPKLAQVFIEENLGLNYNPYTTQIENHDAVAEYCHILSEANTILIDFARDIWTYISLGYFKQKLKENEVGSSTMPHKVNPIDFENAEGNLGIAISMCNHFADKLPISRMQRDLSDSTVQRALGTAFAHSLLAYKSLLKGIAKLEINPAVLEKDLSQSMEVLGEAIQTAMRRYGVSDAYEQLKKMTRGQSVTKETLDKLIEDCAAFPEDEKKRLKNLEPKDYLGFAVDLANSIQ